MTPNIGIDYRSLDFNSGQTTAPYLSFWDTNYGNLTNVAYPTHPSDTGEITFIPDDGWNVRLNGFDLAGYPQVTYPNQTLRILDENYNVLVDYSPVTVLGGSMHTHIDVDTTFSGIIRIQFGNSWDIGIDNFDFDQVPCESSAAANPEQQAGE